MTADPAPGEPIFVVQHHWATADHYDVRLEIDGVLVSWAVPKGPSTDPTHRRLAQRVGDHELTHATFEGVHSGARPGRGAVQIWDYGTFRNVSAAGDASTALAAGHLSVVLAGHRLRGGFSLIRTGGDDRWLLLKKRDEHAETGPFVVDIHTTSVVTGATMSEITAAG